MARETRQEALARLEAELDSWMAQPGRSLEMLNTYKCRRNPYEAAYQFALDYLSESPQFPFSRLPTADEVLRQVKDRKPTAVPFLVSASPAGEEEPREVLFFDIAHGSSIIHVANLIGQEHFRASFLSGIQSVRDTTAFQRSEVIVIGDPDMLHQSGAMMIPEKDVGYSLDECQSHPEIMQYLSDTKAARGRQVRTVVYACDDGKHDDVMGSLITMAHNRTANFTLAVSLHAQSRIPISSNFTLYAGHGAESFLATSGVHGARSRQITPHSVMQITNGHMSPYWTFAGNVELV